MADGIAGGPATPQMRAQGAAVDPFTSLLHWVWYGRGPGAGLGAVPGQFAESINPTNRAGFLNLASMFLGGGGEHPFAGEMPGQFDAYSVPRAQAGGHLGSPREGAVGPKGYNPSMRVLRERAQGVNHQYSADAEKVAAAKNAILEKHVAQEMARHRAMQAIKLRRQVDNHLGSAPMAGHVPHPAPEHDYFDSHEFDHRVNSSRPGDPREVLLHHLMQRRYQAQLGHNHLN